MAVRAGPKDGNHQYLTGTDDPRFNLNKYLTGYPLFVLALGALTCFTYKVVFRSEHIESELWVLMSSLLVLSFGLIFASTLEHARKAADWATLIGFIVAIAFIAQSILDDSPPRDSSNGQHQIAEPTALISASPVASPSIETTPTPFPSAEPATPINELSRKIWDHVQHTVVEENLHLHPDDR